MSHSGAPAPAPAPAVTGSTTTLSSAQSVPGSTTTPPRPPRKSKNNTKHKKKRNPRGNHSTNHYNNHNNNNYNELECWNQQEDQYFDSYAHLGIHEEMLKDFNRTDTYRRAIVENPQDFEGKVVLDVGCGTGVLSIFCVRAGAKKVYGIEASSICDYATAVVAANGFSDRITILKGLVENIELPEKVDVIVSEWMGYFLIYEAMLKTVIFARDKWLKKGGVMYPTEAKLYLAAFSDPEYHASKVEFWNDVFGIDMSAMIPFAKQCALVGAAVDSIKAENVVSDPVVIKTINCLTVTAQDLDSTECNFSFHFNRNCHFHGFAGWFDVTFRPSSQVSNGAEGEGANGCEHSSTSNEEEIGKTIVLSTAPEVGYTHWHHTLFPFEEQILVQEGQELSGSIVVKPKVDAPRHLFITLNFTTNSDSANLAYDF